MHTSVPSLTQMVVRSSVGAISWSRSTQAVRVNTERYEHDGHFRRHEKRNELGVDVAFGVVFRFRQLQVSSEALLQLHDVIADVVRHRFVASVNASLQSSLFLLIV